MAESELFSDALADEAVGQCSLAVQDALKELAKAAKAGQVRLKSWNSDFVAAAVILDVDLPTRGPVNGIDIRSVEPVMLLFHRGGYPNVVPVARSDRKDFPTSRLPHLNPRKKGSAAEFCLHRGNIQDWFAEHSLTDYVERVRGWLRDAASNRLIREDDRFETTRIDTAMGLCLFDPHVLANFVSNEWSSDSGAGASALFSTVLRDFANDRTLDNGFSVEILSVVGFEAASELADKMRKLYSTLAEDAPRLDRPIYSLLLWPKNEQSDEYVASLPGTFEELSQFAQGFGMDLKAAVARFCSDGLKIIRAIPVVVTILRPQKLIGSDSAFEFLPFVIVPSDEDRDEGGNILDSAPVWALSHRRPLTTAFARELSLVPHDVGEKEILVLGCGAEGSKIGLHMGRSGLPKIRFVDTASLSPHNLVRHALLPEDLGKNKATALKEEIERIFYHDSTKNYESIEKNALEAVLATDRKFDLIIDATASASVLEGLIHADIPYSRLARCEMADAGAVGYFVLEGPGRLPRVDDLQANLYDLGLEHPVVTGWLDRHKEQLSSDRRAALENIGIGISCSSDTMRLSDDVISYHASLFAVAARTVLAATPETGRIQLNSLYANRGVAANVATFGVDRPVVLESKGDLGWSVRIAAHAFADLRRFFSRQKLCETGGLLVGMVHKKRKVIYVTRVLPPSRDSQGSPYAFRRGVKDYPEMLDKIHAHTGNLLGYVGEWHTHPRGPAAMSDVDMKAVEGIKQTLASKGIPVHIMILARDETNSFVFSTD